MTLCDSQLCELEVPALPSILVVRTQLCEMVSGLCATMEVGTSTKVVVLATTRVVVVEKFVLVVGEPSGFSAPDPVLEPGAHLVSLVLCSLLLLIVFGRSVWASRGIMVALAQIALNFGLLVDNLV